MKEKENKRAMSVIDVSFKLYCTLNPPLNAITGCKGNTSGGVHTGAESSSHYISLFHCDQLGRCIVPLRWQRFLRSSFTIQALLFSNAFITRRRPRHSLTRILLPRFRAAVPPKQP